MNVVQNYKIVCEKAAECALLAGRDPETVRLVTVTKHHSWSEAQPIFQDGGRDFGENRLQEALVKMGEAPKEARWHLIGTLQKNKVRKALSHFCLIHSVDSAELAIKISEVSQELGIVTNILLQANTSGEQAKHGLSPAQWEEQIEKIIGLPGIDIKGLMTMAPLAEDEKTIRKCFAGLRNLRDVLASKTQLPLPELSMGMSLDYPLAIAEGATLIRIGSAIFQ